MSSMFWGAQSFRQDLSAWVVGKQTDTRNMFTSTSFDVAKSASWYTLREAVTVEPVSDREDVVAMADDPGAMQFGRGADGTAA